MKNELNRWKRVGMRYGVGNSEEGAGHIWSVSCKDRQQIIDDNLEV